MIIDPTNVPEITGSKYPQQFQSAVAGRVKKRLGDAAGLQNFGVNLVRLAPGSCSALRHWHTRQDELIYVLEGEVTLITNSGERVLKPGMAAGFPAGDAATLAAPVDAVLAAGVARYSAFARSSVTKAKGGEPSPAG